MKNILCRGYVEKTNYCKLLYYNRITVVTSKSVTLPPDYLCCMFVFNTSLCECLCVQCKSGAAEIVSTVPYCTHMLIVTLYTGSALNPLHLFISLSLSLFLLSLSLNASELILKAKCKSFQ